MTDIYSLNSYMQVYILVFIGYSLQIFKKIKIVNEKIS